MKLEVALTLYLLLVFPSISFAEEMDVSEIKENITIFSGILEDALELNQSSGIFGMQLGGVQGSYLVGQGAVFEIRTPLSNKRSRAGLGSLNLAMQSLQLRANPFEIVARNAEENSAAIAASSASVAGEASAVYQQMMDRIANIDYSLVMSAALQQASEAARSLRNLGSVGPEGYEALQVEIESLREASQQRSAEIREMVNSLQSSSGGGADHQASETSLEADFENLLSAVEPLKQQALAKAAELKALSEQAQADFARQLDADIIAFESQLFESMCVYGSTLREVPASESVSLILTGLGESVDISDRANKVFVLKKADLESCQTGGIDASELQANAAAYSY